MTMTPAQVEAQHEYAYARGKDAGYDAANFRNAYGPDEARPDETLQLEGSRRAREAYSHVADIGAGLVSTYLIGWGDGVDAWTHDQNDTAEEN